MRPMKSTALLSVCLAAAGLLAAGCGHLSLSSAGDGGRVLVGTINYAPAGPDMAAAAAAAAGQSLPPDAEVLVRVVDPNPPNPLQASAMAANPAAPPLFNGQNQTPAQMQTLGPQILGEQSIRNPGPSPVPFRVEFNATDDQLRHGLNVDVRISYGGRIRYANPNQYEVTLGDLSDPNFKLTVSVAPM